MADRDRKLSHEDRIVWEKVTRTIRRLRGVSHFEPDETAAEHVADDSATASPPPTGEQPMPAAPVRRHMKLHPIERPIQRKIARGRIAIDGRIDLHGLNQSEAHNLLLDFLVRAREHGRRHVLVITGKGTSSGGDGILRRMVPQWLEKADFRLIVSGYEQAARGHGGEGALYVRLRRQGGEGR